ncbi:hypothetical protein DBR06_SOUSAS110083, partial [Sousa chinensis]
TRGQQRAQLRGLDSPGWGEDPAGLRPLPLASGAARIPPPQRALPVVLRSAFRQYPDGSIMAAIRDSQAMGTTTDMLKSLARAPSSRVGQGRSSVQTPTTPSGRWISLVLAFHEDDKTLGPCPVSFSYSTKSFLAKHYKQKKRVKIGSILSYLIS